MWMGRVKWPSAGKARGRASQGQPGAQGGGVGLWPVLRGLWGRPSEHTGEVTWEPYCRDTATLGDRPRWLKALALAHLLT